MPSLPEIVKTPQKEWENRHLTFVQPIEGLYDMWNADTGDLIAGYNAMTQAVQEFIAQAIRDGVSIRALGAGWSWTRVAATEGRMLNTKNLNWIFDISDASVSPVYSGSREHLVFAQCGASVREINVHLEKKNQALRTTGASNGQTIVGAFSAGTHGSAFDYGSITEYVVGLHLITGPDRHVWLERASHPVAADALPARLGAEIVRDDALWRRNYFSCHQYGWLRRVAR